MGLVLTQDQKPTPRPTRRKNQIDASLVAIPPGTLSRMSRSLLATSSPAEAVKEHLGAVHEMVRARTTFAALFEPEKNLLAVAGLRGKSDEELAVACKPGEGLVGRAYGEGKLLRDDEGRLAVPLLDGERPIGVLVAVGARVSASDEIWGAVAGHLVAALHVARLRDAAIRRTRDLETAIAGLKSLEQARDDLLGGASHDLKTPLSVITMSVGSLLRERQGSLTDRQRESLRACARNGDRLLRMINDMVLMSRLRSGRMELSDKPFGLRALAQETAGSMTTLAKASEVTLDLDRAGEVFVKGDRGKMSEALAHLLEYGIIHNRPGGRVAVTTEAGHGVAVIRVSDDGDGIHPDDLPHVFDRFYRGHGAAPLAGNSGLGLAIVRQIVQLHGGSVSVESSWGKGSTFTVTLPLFAGAVSLATSTSEARDGAILVVEDDADCREVLGMVLESEGMSVVSAHDSAAALSSLSGTRPALVLLDLRLGGGDGRTVLEHIRADSRLAQTPVFVISGAADSSAGFRYDGPERIDGFFEKPLNLPRLLERIREVVHVPGEAAEG